MEMEPVFKKTIMGVKILNASPGEIIVAENKKQFEIAEDIILSERGTREELEPGVYHFESKNYDFRVMKNY